MPGRSSLRTTSMWRAGGTSIVWSSTMTMRGSACRPTSVPASAWPPPHGDQVHVVLRGRGGGLAHLHAALGGQLRGVDERDGLVADPPEVALEQREREDAGVVAGDLTLVLDVEAVGSLSGERREQLAEPLGQRQERPNGLGGLGRADVHGEGDELAGQRQLDLLGDRVAGLVLGFVGARPEVGRDHDRVELEERRARSSAPSRTRRARHRPTRPDRIASASAASSTMPPRPTLMSGCPGLAFASRSASISPDRLGRLGHVDGHEVGQLAISSSRSSSSTLIWRARSAETNGS